jgi:hypothetical protein
MMRNAAVACIAIALVASCCVSVSFGASSEDPELLLGTGQGTINSEVTIPVTLVGKGEPIAGVSSDITFNPTLLEFKAAVKGPAATSAGKNVNSNVVEPGLLRIGVIGFNTTVIPDGIVAYLSFAVKQTIPDGTTFLTNSPLGTTAVPPIAISMVGYPGSISMLLTLTPSAGPNGTIDPSAPITVAYGSTRTFNFTPDAHYHVADVIVDSESVGAQSSVTFENVTEDHTVSVSFSIDQFTVSASVTGRNGSVNPASQTVNYGGTASIDLVPDTGYHVASITDNGQTKTIADPYVITNVTAAHTVVVTYAVDTFSVGASVTGGHGSVNPGSQTVNYGGTATIDLLPNPWYTVASITDNGVAKAIADPYVINNVTANHTIVVTFQEDFPWEIFLPAILNGKKAPAQSVME